jgi:hypothetical protein
MPTYTPSDNDYYYGEYDYDVDWYHRDPQKVSECVSCWSTVWDNDLYVVCASCYAEIHLSFKGDPDPCAYEPDAGYFLCVECAEGD